MIAQLSGKLIKVSLNSLVLDVHGVGYEVIISPNLVRQLELGESLTLHVSQVIREDSWSLYGFSDEESKELFLILQSVSGIGPKAAYTLLSAMPAQELRRAIANSDNAALESVPGVGKKMASRMILELKERFAASAGNPNQPHWRLQVIEALVGLGYQIREAESALDKAKAASDTNFESLELPEILRRTLSQTKSGK